jgi:hypothetical protein
MNLSFALATTQILVPKVAGGTVGVDFRHKSRFLDWMRGRLKEQLRGKAATFAPLLQLRLPQLLYAGRPKWSLGGLIKVLMHEV